MKFVNRADRHIVVASGHEGIDQFGIEFFATADDFETMHPAVELDPGFPVPGIAALEIGVARRDATADYLTQWQIDFDELPDGRLAVPAREANGTILFFAET